MKKTLVEYCNVCDDWKTFDLINERLVMYKCRGCKHQYDFSMREKTLEDVNQERKIRDWMK